jgi:hypothetical protein
VNEEPDGVEIAKARVQIAPGFAAELATAGLARLDALSSRALGTVVTDHRSSWVRSTVIGSEHVYIKTYDYPTPRDRLRGIGRTTALAPSRARREWDALAWMRAAGFPAAVGLCVAEDRRLGFLRRAVLVTRAVAGERVDALLARLDARSAGELLRAVARAVEAWHRRGYRDRNLDLRNLLARAAPGGGWEVVKIDSPRFRLRRPGPAVDRLAREDWARLRRSAAAVGADWPRDDPAP